MSKDLRMPSCASSRRATLKSGTRCLKTRTEGKGLLIETEAHISMHELIAALDERMINKETFIEGDANLGKEREELSAYL